jgi:hypothetical protein
MSTGPPETAESLNVAAISYRVPCNAPLCHSHAGVIFRYADAGGRPIAHPVLHQVMS